MKRDEKEQKIWNKKVGCSIKYFTFATNKEAYRRTQKNTISNLKRTSLPIIRSYNNRNKRQEASHVVNKDLKRKPNKTIK